MKLFLDASAIVAILAREPEAASFDEIVTNDFSLLTSAVALWEASRGLAGARGVSFEEARNLVASYVREFDVRLVSVGAAEAVAAMDAHQRFGKGRQGSARCTAQHGRLFRLRLCQTSCRPYSLQG